MRLLVLLTFLISCGGQSPSGVVDSGRDSDFLVSVWWSSTLKKVPTPKFLGGEPGYLANTEYAAAPWKSGRDRGRGWAYLGICTPDGWFRSSDPARREAAPYLGVPSCVVEWEFPLRVTALRSLWVRDSNGLGGRQVGWLEKGDLVTIHEVKDVPMGDGNWSPMVTEIDFPAVRELPCIDKEIR